MFPLSIKLIQLFFVLFFSLNCFSQNVQKQFSEIDFYLLSEIVKLSNDSTRVNNTLNDKSFHFYNYDKKNMLFASGYEIAYPFVGKTAIVKDQGNWKLIDKSGNFIFDSEMPIVPKLSSYEKYALFYDGKFVYDLRNGKQRNGYIGCAEPSSPYFFISKTANNKYQLINRETKETIFKSEMDSIISQNFLLYRENDNLLIVKKKNKYGLFLSDGTELQKIQFSNAKFLGNYILLNDGKKWNYYLYRDRKLKLIITTEIECTSPAYQNNVIGIFATKDRKFNLLKTNGEKLSKSFEYINSDATYAIDDNKVYIFDSSGNFYEYYIK